MTPKIADLFFTRSHSILSNAIRYFTNGKYSHVMGIVAIENNEISVVSADANGVFCRDVRDDEWEHYSILTCPTMLEEQRKDVVKFCLSQIGDKYDFTGIGSFLFNTDMQDKDRWYCSELAYCAYKEAGIHLAERVQQCYISPEILYVSPLLVEIEKGGEEE